MECTDLIYPIILSLSDILASAFDRMQRYWRMLRVRKRGLCASAPTASPVEESSHDAGRSRALLDPGLSLLSSCSANAIRPRS